MVEVAQTVVDPCPRAGVANEGETGVKSEVALGVFVEFGGHGPDNRQIIRAPALKFGEHGTDFDAALTATFELEWAGEDVPVVVELGALDIDRHGFPGQRFQLRFGIEGVNM